MPTSASLPEQAGPQSPGGPPQFPDRLVRGPVPHSGLIGPEEGPPIA